MSLPDGSPGRPLIKYEQLVASLQEKIATMAPHAALPTERALREEFALSRTTVRRAIQVLLRNGLVYNIQGSGTYVANPAVVSKTLRLTGFSEDMKQRGLAPSSQVLKQGPAAASAELASLLEVDLGAPLLMLHRLRLADEAPMALEEICLVTDRVRAAQPLDYGRSLYEQLNQAGIVVDRAAQTIEAVNLDAEQARHLDQAVGAAALRVTRTTYTDRGQPFERAATTYRGDRYSFEIGVGIDL